MSESTAICLDDHLVRFIETLVSQRRFASAGEVVRAPG
jgi:Arc/MetJ-type ribon-helix-helix transcriptional regulator